MSAAHGYREAVTETTEFPDANTLSYEEARDELRHVVSRLETGGEPLELSLALWERGEALANRCQQWLDGARERLTAAQERTEAQAQAQVAETSGAPDVEAQEQV